MKFFYLWEAQFVLLSLYFVSTDDNAVETEYTGKSVFFLFNIRLVSSWARWKEEEPS